MASKRELLANPLPARLRQLRELRGLSQRELGIKAGIDPSAASPRVNQYERGRHAPNFMVAAKLAEALGAPAAYLYAQDDELAALILEFKPSTDRGTAGGRKRANSRPRSA